MISNAMMIAATVSRETSPRQCKRWGLEESGVCGGDINFNALSLFTVALMCFESCDICVWMNVDEYVRSAECNG